MMELFAGFEGAHGTHGEPQQDADSVKWHIKKTARTISGAGPTVKLWEQHLAGKTPLGVAPIRSDNMCVWGCGDVDDYEVNALELIRQIEKMKLPLVPCRSKSGGLHLFLFLAQPAPATEVQRFLRDVMARLGYANSEVFPKQTEVLLARGDKPNWMVMPYFGGDFGGRLMLQVGLKASGGEQTPEEFLTFAEGMRQPRDALAVRARRPTGQRRSAGAAEAPEPDQPFGDGPPCLQHLAAAGVHAGQQNNTLLMMGIYFKKRWPADWKEHLERANIEFLDPPGSAEGLTSVIRSLSSKDYNYTCKTEPMKSHCNSAMCRARRFGVGEEGAFPVISGIAKLDTDPPIWFISVEEQRLEVSTDTLQNYQKFHAVCMDRLNRCFTSLKQTDWLAVLSEAMRDVHLIESPPEVGRTGVFAEMLEEFLTNRQRGTTKEDILRGRPWEDEEEGRHYFQLKDLAKFLLREGDKTTTRGQMTSAIRKMGGDSKFINIKSTGRNVWWVPSDQFSHTTSGDPPPVRGVPV
jgi:hypothetical protein